MSAALALDPRVRALHPDEQCGSAFPDGPTHPAELAPRMPDGRPRLRLVPTGPQVGDASAALTMTRRGRLLRSGLVAAVTLAVAWTVVSAITAGAAAAHVVTVTRGQTLSEIAARQLPDLPVRDGVAALQLANGLNTSDIHAGQVLTVPDAG